MIQQLSVYLGIARNQVKQFIAIPTNSKLKIKRLFIDYLPIARDNLANRGLPANSKKTRLPVNGKRRLELFMGYQ